MAIAIGVVVVLVVLVAAAIAYGIYLSNLIRDGSLSSRHRTLPFDIIASSEGDGQITLRAMNGQGRAMDIRHDGIFGIISADGYGQVGGVIDLGDGAQGDVEPGDGYAVREYTALTTTISAAEAARLDIYAYPDDPETAHGIAHEKISYKSELGECAAWFIPGNSKTWVIFAHGRGAHPNEALRIMPTLVDAGLPILVINYRNDDGAPASGDGWHWLGATEWRDLESAVQYALDNGADDVVLYGYSMGGGMCLNLLYESELADNVRGVVMDSPLLDFGGTLDYVGHVRGYPRLMVRFGKAVAAWRFGINWQRMNYLNRASDLRAPILILHGEADDLVPAPISRLLQHARPDIVSYIGFPDATHARSWNLDNARYESAVRDFLQEILCWGASPQASP